MFFSFSFVVFLLAVLFACATILYVVNTDEYNRTGTETGEC